MSSPDAAQELSSTHLQPIVVGHRSSRSRSRSPNRRRSPSTSPGRSTSRGRPRSPSHHAHVSYNHDASEYHRAYSPAVLASVDPIPIGEFVSEEVEAGALKAEVLAQTWSRRGLHVAYIGLFMLAFTVSLAIQTTSVLTPFATSEFGAHSLLATVQVVQGILYAVVKAPVAKLANALGRLEAFVLAIALLATGYFQMALSRGAGSYISAQILSAAGQTGNLMLQQIFVADTTDLLNRALFSALPDTPFLATVWIGPGIASFVTEKLSWRAGYAVWVILIPSSALPLLLVLWQAQRKARKLGLANYSWTGQSFVSVLFSIPSALDLVGLLLLTGGCALFLIPLTLNSARSWTDLRTGLLAGGVVVLVVFVFWELRVPRPLLSLRILRNRTIRSACVTIFFYDMAFNIFQPYLFSYLMVTRSTTTASAGRAVQTFSFAATIAAVMVSFLVKRSARYKRWMLIGIPIYQLGILSMHFSRSPEVGMAFTVLSQAIAGIGGGVLAITSQVGVQASCSHSDTALATALFLTIFSLGSAVGASVAGTIWTYWLPRLLTLYVPPSIRDQVPNIYGDFNYARQMFPDLNSPERQAIVMAYDKVMERLIWVALGVTVPSFVSGLFMREYNLDALSEAAIASRLGNLHAYSPLGFDAYDELAVVSSSAPVLIGTHADRTSDGDEIMSVASEEHAVGAGID